jgi:hypothetical protein
VLSFSYLPSCLYFAWQMCSKFEDVFFKQIKIKKSFQNRLKIVFDKLIVLYIGLQGLFLVINI